MSIPRREVLRMVAAMPVAAWLGGAVAAVPARRLFVYEPRLPAALWRPLAVRQGLAAGALALPGDVERVRFARACLAQGPEWIGGVLRPGDFLVLAGSAEEEGYRLREERMLRSPRQSSHVVFSMQHRSRGVRA
jgi:hypothetical protein